MEVLKTEPVTVSATTNHIVYKLDQNLETSTGKATLANLRNSIERPLSQSMAIWPLLFENLPENFLSQKQTESKKEKAILAALQFYALYRQGKQGHKYSDSKSENSKGNRFKNIGYSLGALRRGDNSIAVDRRFNALITATSYDELIHHLRQMIKLLKSKTSGEEVIDFGRLAQDLYSFLIGKDENIRLSWARAYYYRRFNKGEEDEQE